MGAVDSVSKNYPALFDVSKFEPKYLGTAAEALATARNMKIQTDLAEHANRAAPPHTFLQPDYSHSWTARGWSYPPLVNISWHSIIDHMVIYFSNTN